MDTKDLRDRLDELFSDVAHGAEKGNGGKNGSAMDDIVAGLLEGEVVAERVMGESELEEVQPAFTPPKPGDEPAPDAAAVDLPPDEAMAGYDGAESELYETWPGKSEVIDALPAPARVEEAVELPVHATDHPLYQDIENLINQGDWQAARPLLAELLVLYPNDAYLKEVADSIQTRSALWEFTEEAVAEPRRQGILARGLKFVVPAMIVVALLSVAVAALLILRLWILPQATAQRQMARLSQIRQDARAALTSGDYDRAMLAYNEILDLLPDDPEAQGGLAQAGQLRATASLYSEAIAAMEAHHWEDALLLLQQLSAEQPGYRDVEERITFVQEQQVLSTRFSQAESLFKQADYAAAIPEYEALQALDYGFQRESVQSHLFLSYLQLGLADEAAAGSDPQGLRTALEYLDKALALRPDDTQTKGESQILRLYMSGLEEYEAGNWAAAIANMTPVYEARPDFADGALAQQLYEAHVGLGDELLADGKIEQALAGYEEARLVKGVDASGLDQKISAAEAMLVTPTPTPELTQAASVPADAGSASAPRPAPTATPIPLPYSLKGMNVKSNCDGRGYIHGIVWSAYNMPMSGITIQAINTTTGFGPLVSLPTNEDGIYQIILEKDQIDGLWMVQVLENGQPASQAWGQHLGGGCVNGAQELKVDWQRAREIQ
jgi:tetratricopeptide (TPR) repeat protein